LSICYATRRPPPAALSARSPGTVAALPVSLHQRRPVAIRRRPHARRRALKTVHRPRRARARSLGRGRRADATSSPFHTVVSGCEQASGFSSSLSLRTRSSYKSQGSPRATPIHALLPQRSEFLWTQFDFVRHAAREH
jgi:hypothetical protein